MSLERLHHAVVEAGLATGVVLLVIMASAAIGWLLNFDQVPQNIALRVEHNVTTTRLVCQRASCVDPSRRFPLLHSDDTPMKVLSLMKERERAEAGGVKPLAKAINTSGIVPCWPATATSSAVWCCSSPATPTRARSWLSFHQQHSRPVMAISIPGSPGRSTASRSNPTHPWARR